MATVQVMETWPFSLILPEDFAALTDREKALLESMTAAFLAFALAQRDDIARPTEPRH